MKKLTILLVMLLAAGEAYSPVRHQDPAEMIEQYLSLAPLTPENLQLAFSLNGIIAPAVVMAQSALETGHYSSRLCTECNNLFGMNYPRQRPTTAAGSSIEGFAVYLSWYDSVKDMKLFQQWYLSRGWDLDVYMLFLKALGYAEDPEYINKLTLLCTI
jgi:flagellum-specific peptidoglycan hydrolase FlgJ